MSFVRTKIRRRVSVWAISVCLVETGKEHLHRVGRVLVDGPVGRPRRTIQGPRAHCVSVEGQRDVLEICAALQDAHEFQPTLSAVLP